LEGIRGGGELRLTRDFLSSALKSHQRHSKIKLNKFYLSTHIMANKTKLINNITNNGNSVAVQVSTALPAQIYCFVGVSKALISLLSTDFPSFLTRPNKSANSANLSPSNNQATNHISGFFYGNEYTYCCAPASITAENHISTIVFTIPSNILVKVANNPLLIQLVFLSSSANNSNLRNSALPRGKQGPGSSKHKEIPADYEENINFSTPSRQKSVNKGENSSIVATQLRPAIELQGVSLNPVNSELPGSFNNDLQQKNAIFLNNYVAEDSKTEGNRRKSQEIKQNEANALTFDENLMELTAVALSPNENYVETGPNSPEEGASPLSPTSPALPYQSKALNQLVFRRNDSFCYNLNEIYGLEVQNPSKIPSKSENSAVSGRSNDLDCIICLSVLREVLFLPCRHVCLCGNCFKNVAKCPICREKIVSHAVWKKEKKGKAKKDKEKEKGKEG
jgi:hypothetical protein